MKHARKIRTSYESDGMPPDIIHAAMIGDIDEAFEALNDNPNCIEETGMYDMNALQLAIIYLHTDFGLFLLDNTAISSRHTDETGRDSLDLALIFSNNELGDQIWEKWNKEYKFEVSSDEFNIAPFNPKPK